MFSHFITIAQAATDDAAFGKALDPIIANIVNPLVMLAFAVAVVAFVYGVIQMIIHATDAQQHKNGRLSMIGGLIGMFIMFSAWGIINIISNTVKGFQ
ncbi:MAG: hypothetical protein WCV82_00465 [Candidatus Paceibacterota bacterium]